MGGVSEVRLLGFCGEKSRTSIRSSNAGIAMPPAALAPEAQLAAAASAGAEQTMFVG